MLKKLIYELRKFFLRILGDIKVFKFPMFIVYDPTSFQIKGYHTRDAIDVIQPGDIILRVYKHYLDGWFIPKGYTEIKDGKKIKVPGYSHTGIYVGDNKVVHAIAQGVSEIDIIDFLRCDGFCILRCKDESLRGQAVQRAVKWYNNGIPYDFNFKLDEQRLYCHQLGAHAYEQLNLKKYPCKLFGIITLKLLGQKYFDRSFLQSEDFQKILEYRP